MLLKKKYWILPVWVWALVLSVLSTSSVPAQSGITETKKGNTGNLISWWSFDSENGRSVYDEIQQKKEW